MAHIVISKDNHIDKSDIQKLFNKNDEILNFITGDTWSRKEMNFGVKLQTNLGIRWHRVVVTPLEFENKQGILVSLYDPRSIDRKP